MLGDLWDTISGWMGSTLSSILESILNATIFRLFYYIERILCWIIGVLYQMFEVFAGLVRVKYGNTSQFLINIFFSNKAVSNIYWGMALIGIVLTFGFAIAAVVRKSFDSSGKVQQSLGQIIWSGIRSIAVIVGMTAIMSFVLNGTGVLMQQINLLFQDPYNLDKPITRTFTGEEFAAMGRVFSTIGTYSVVDSQENRYNLNLCYNDIRQDMAFLERAGVFAYSYYEKDQDGNEKQSWQSVLSTIAKSCDLSSDVKVDSYNDGVSRSITAAMEYLRTTANPKPVPSVDRGSFTTSDGYRLMKQAIKDHPRDLPQAFFAANDSLAIGALRALQEAGIKVPEQVSLISFNDTAIAKQVFPQLSAVTVFTEQMGSTAAEIMDRELNGRQVSPVPFMMKFATKLTLRGTSIN